MGIGRAATLPVIAIAAGYACPTAAHDQGAVEAGFAVNEIVVTARFREEALLDVPIAITALSGEKLLRQDRSSLQAVSQIVPTLDFRIGASNKDRSLFIRGLGTITSSSGVEPSVATVIDGVVLARPGQSTIDLLDVERIEVLRGPQGTMFGKNASAGVVNIVSRRPTSTLTVDGQLSYYEDGEYRIRLGASGPVTGNLGFTLGGVVADYRGNVVNLANGDRVNGFERRGLRGKLVLEPSAALTVTLIGDYARTKEDVPIGVSLSTSRVAFPSGEVAANPALAVSLQADGIAPSPRNRRIRSTFNSSVRDENYGTSLTAELDLGEYQITSITAYREWKNRQHQDWDAFTTLLPEVPQGEDWGRVRTDQLSQELRLTSPKGGFVDYVIGLYYFHSKTHEDYRRGVTQAAGPAPITNTGTAAFQTKLNNYSVFGEANFNLADPLRIILGGRLIHDDLAFQHRRVSTTPGVPGIRGDFAASGKTRETDFSLRAGAQYDLSNRLMSYATYSRGYKGPAYNVFFNMQDFDTLPLAPETSDSFELGLKGHTTDNVMSFSLAAYYTRVSGFQANMPDEFLGTLVTRLINAGAVVSKGFEADVTIRPDERLAIGASLAHVDARIDAFRCPTGVPAGTCAGPDGKALVNGGQLPFAPRWKYHIDAVYTAPLGDRLALELASDLSFRSETQYMITQTPDTVQPAYGILNASAGLIHDRWSVRLMARNLTNTHYSPFIAYGAVAGVSRFVPRDDARYFGINAAFGF